MASYSSRNSMRRNVHSKHGDRFLYELSPGQIGTYKPASSSQRNYLQPPSVNVLKVTTPTPSLSQHQDSKRRGSSSEPGQFYGGNGFTPNIMNPAQATYIPPYGYSMPYPSGPTGFVGQQPAPFLLQGGLSQQNAAVIPVEFTPNLNVGGRFGYGAWPYGYPYHFSRHQPQQSVIVLQDRQSTSPKKEKSSSKHHYYGANGEPLSGPPGEFATGNLEKFGYNTQPYIEKDAYVFNGLFSQQKQQNLHLPPIHENFTLKGVLHYGQLAQVEFGDASKLRDFVISELQQKYGQAKKAEVTVTAVNGQYNISGCVLDEPKDENSDNNYILEKYLNELYRKQKRKKGKRRKRQTDSEEESEDDDED